LYRYEYMFIMLIRMVVNEWCMCDKLLAKFWTRRKLLKMLKKKISRYLKGQLEIKQICSFSILDSIFHIWYKCSSGKVLIPWDIRSRMLNSLWIANRIFKLDPSTLFINQGRKFHSYLNQYAITCNYCDWINNERINKYWWLDSV